MPDPSFGVRFDSSLRQDLRRRLDQVRWSDAVTTDWQYGTCEPFLRTLVQHWRTVYDFDMAEERLNALPQFRADIDGFGIHYVHLKGRGPQPGRCC